MNTKKRIGKYLIYMEAKLGSGAFSDVYKGIHQQTKEQVAVKIVNKIKIQEDQYTKNAFYSEIQIMKRLKSLNIIKFYDVHETKNNFYMILELADNGTFRGVLMKSEGKKLDEKQAFRCLIQILNGFGELVKNGVIHRDLKPQNILIKDQTLKIADFGFAKHSQNNSFLKTIVGTPAYMAPQILNEQKYTFKCDIWSLGVIMYEMLVGKTPWTFKEKTFEAVRQEICTRKIEIPEQLGINQNFKGLIMGCLCQDQAKRFGWEEIFLHPLFGIKYKANFQNKKQGHLKLGYIMSNLRMHIHSKNINLVKEFSKIGDVMPSQIFYVLLRQINKEITEEQVMVLFVNLARQGNVFVKDFESLLTKFGCRLTGIDLSKMEVETSTEKQKGFELMSKLKEKIEKENLSVTSTFQTKANKNNKINIEYFGKLLSEIQTTLNNQETECLFNEFDVNGDGFISYNQFYTGLCKIAQQIPIQQE